MRANSCPDLLSLPAAADLALLASEILLFSPNGDRRVCGDGKYQGSVCRALLQEPPGRILKVGKACWRLRTASDCSAAMSCSGWASPRWNGWRSVANSVPHSDYSVAERSLFDQLQ